MAEQDLVYAEKLDGGIAVIYFNQPEKKNAIRYYSMSTVRDLLFELDLDKDVRVIVLRGVGGNFSSGADLSATPPEEASTENTRMNYRHWVGALQAVRSIAKSVIAMVDGYAVGGAFCIALACDLLCVSETAIGYPAFCQIGLAPELGIAKILPDLIGAQRAKEVIFLAQRLSGQRMYELGIANRVCPSEELEAVTMELAAQVAAMPDTSVQVAKGMINAVADINLGVSLQMEQTASPFCSTTKAFAETKAKFRK